MVRRCSPQVFDYGENQMHKTSRVRFAFFCSDNRKSKARTELSRSIQNRKCAGLVAIGVAFATCGAVATAQQPAKVPPIGYLSAPPLSVSAARIEAFRQGLRELGYVEGKNIVIEYRWAEGKPERLPDLAAEL